MRSYRGLGKRNHAVRRQEAQRKIYLRFCGKVIQLVAGEVVRCHAGKNLQYLYREWILVGDISDRDGPGSRNSTVRIVAWSDSQDAGRVRAQQFQVPFDTGSSVAHVGGGLLQRQWQAAQFAGQYSGANQIWLTDVLTKQGDGGVRVKDIQVQTAVSNGLPPDVAASGNHYVPSGHRNLSRSMRQDLFSSSVVRPSAVLAD
jgi:hypothetical protein